MTSRRDFIKASAASAALIGIPMATIANPESIEDNQKDFYRSERENPNPLGLGVHQLTLYP